MGLVVVLPLLAPGFTLVYDMVFVPRPEVSAELLGATRSVPRTVPSAFLVAVLSWGLTGQIVQKAALLGIFAGGAWGAARLVPTHRATARIAGGVLYVWNPFTYERILLGHWALLLGYALLPWVVGAALRVRRGEPRAGWRLLLWLAAATAPSPYTGMVGVGLAAALAMWPENDAEPAPGAEGGDGPSLGRRAGIVLGAGLVASLPWLVPAVLHAGLPEEPAVALELFRARSDSPLGTLGSLLSLGGMWRTDLAPPGRDTLAWIPAFAFIAALVVVGLGPLGRRWGRGAGAGLVAASGAGLLLALAPSVPGLDDAVAWAARTVPGGGVLRDSQKFVIPLALLGSVAFGLGVEAALLRVPKQRAARLAASALLVVLPVALAPTLAWGAGGRLFTAKYPSSWAEVEQATAEDQSPGAILVLPWHAHMPFGWNRDRTVHQPADLYFSREVVASTALEVGDVRLPQEDPWAALLDPVVDEHRTEQLASSGVRFVLLFREADSRSFEPLVDGLEPVLDRADLALYRVRGPVEVLSFDEPPLAPIVAADLLLLAALVLAGGRIASSRGSGERSKLPAMLRRGVPRRG